MRILKFVLRTASAPVENLKYETNGMRTVRVRSRLLQTSMSSPQTRLSVMAT